jgi:hypothetical protein
VGEWVILTVSAGERIRKRFNLVLVLASVSAATGLGCSYIKGTHTLSSSSVTGERVTLNQTSYQSTVYAYVNKIGCNGCHASGPTVSVDWFASTSLDSAFQSAIRLVDVSNPANSLFVGHISDGHCGFPAICGVDNSTMIAQIKQWIALSASSSGGPGGGTPCTFNGLALASGSSTSGYSANTVPYGQTCDSVKINVTCTNGNISPSNAFSACTVAPGATCSFNGQTLQTGGTVTAYQYMNVPYGSTCASETRTCTNGTLSGSFTFGTCSVAPPASCTFNGQTFASGMTTQGYPTATVPFGQTCQAQTITCTNGVLNPANDVAACTVQPPANCTFNGQTVASGSSVVAFQAASVPSGQTCVSQNRTCTNGTLSGTFTFASCVVNQPATCTFNGQTIASGATTQGYPSATVPFGQTCQAQTITCTNGVLNPANDVASCSVLPGATCSFNGQTIQSGSSVTAYSSATVPFGSQCSSVAQTRTCTNGTLSGTSTFASCIVNPPANCTFNGQTVASGSTVQGYPTATVPYGQTCQSQTITCTNGNLNPANDVAACTVQPGASCSFNGQTMASGSTVTGYTSASVAPGQVCSPVTVTCTNGTITPSSASPTCVVSTAVYGSTFVPANQALLLRLNVGLNLPGQKTFQCENANNCSNLWNNSAQYNVSFQTNPNTSTGANQVSLLAFAGCNDINPSDWGVDTSSTVANQTTNLINAGVKFVDNHTGGLGSNSAFNSQVKAAFQALISDPAYSGASVNQVFIGICTAANTFGVGMKGY